jgi:hypothetical protein
MANETIEITIKGKSFTVPALNVCGKHVVVRGKWLRIAYINDEQWLETEVEDPALCIEMLNGQKANELRADIFTFSQKLPATNPKYSYPVEWDSIAAVRISNFKEWWEGLPQETRKNVRRSQKRGVVVTVKELDEFLIKELVKLNNQSLFVQGRRNIHYGKNPDQVRQSQSSFLDRSSLICAYFGNELIGYMKIVYSKDTASILHIIPSASHQDKRPSNALIAKAVELCAAREISYLIFGNFNYGNKKDNPLREFKVRNGFHEILLPRFNIPLTMWGRLCMKAKLHRGLLGILPHSLITLGLNARTKWYDFVQSIKPV